MAGGCAAGMARRRRALEKVRSRSKLITGQFVSAFADHESKHRGLWWLYAAMA